MAAVGEEQPQKTRNFRRGSEQLPDKGDDGVTCKELMCRKIGLEDFCSPQVWRASIAELVGTGILVFNINAIAISSVASQVDSPAALAAVLASLCVAILLLATFPISGGHLNPAITVAAALLGAVSLARSVVYVLAQCAGAILGALLLKAVLGDAAHGSFFLGGCTLAVSPHAAGVNASTALWLEAACTFVLLFAVRIAFDEQHARALGPVALCGVVGATVGLMGFVSAMVTAKAGYAGAGMNPARCVGAAVVMGGEAWREQWVFWVGPAMACGAFCAFATAVPRRHFNPHAGDHAVGFAALKLLCMQRCGEKPQHELEV